jgi:hypothetical protein
MGKPNAPVVHSASDIPCSGLLKMTENDLAADVRKNEHFVEPTSLKKGLL